MNKLLQMLDGKPYIETLDEVKNEPGEVRKAGMSDYCLANGGCVSWSDATTPYGQPTCDRFLSSLLPYHSISFVAHSGNRNNKYPEYTGAGVVPALRFNLPSKDFINSLSAEELFGCEISVGTVEYEDDKGRVRTYHTITFPNTRVVNKKADKELTAKLQEAMQKGLLEKTSQGYTGRMNQDKTFKKFDTYQYNGKEYAYVQAEPYDSGNSYQDGSPVVDGEWIFLEIGPATLRIKNKWKNLPKCINPNGNGKDDKLNLRVLDAVNAGVPFSQDSRVCYEASLCDLRRYVEEEFVHDFFLDEENFLVKGKNVSKKSVEKYINNLSQVEAGAFVKGSEEMGKINQEFIDILTSYADSQTAQSKTDEEFSKNEAEIERLKEEYNNVVEAKRRENGENAALEAKRGAAAGDIYSSIGELKDFKHKKFPQGERVHMDRHSFNHDDELV